jgi:hypothetical protein
MRIICLAKRRVAGCGNFPGDLAKVVVVMLLLLLLLQAVRPCSWQGRLVGADERLLPQGTKGGTSNSITFSGSFHGSNCGVANVLIVAVSCCVDACLAAAGEHVPPKEAQGDGLFNSSMVLDAFIALNAALQRVVLACCTDGCLHMSSYIPQERKVTLFEMRPCGITVSLQLQLLEFVWRLAAQSCCGMGHSD